MPEKLSRNEYRLLVEKAPIMIWRANPTMACDYFNEVWLAFTGRSMEQEVGNGWAEGVHKDDFDRCLKIYTSSFAKREIFEMEYRLRRFDGEFRWLFDRGVPCFDNNQFKGYIGSCVDITERKEAQEALRKAHEKEIQELQSCLPLCMYCKKIRNDKNYWEQIESYLAQKSSLFFSHGICPDCKQKAQEEMQTDQDDQLPGSEE